MCVTQGMWEMGSLGCSCSGFPESSLPSFQGQASGSFASLLFCYKTVILGIRRGRGGMRYTQGSWGAAGQSLPSWPRRAYSPERYRCVPFRGTTCPLAAWYLRMWVAPGFCVNFKHQRKSSPAEPAVQLRVSLSIISEWPSALITTCLHVGSSLLGVEVKLESFVLCFRLTRLTRASFPPHLFSPSRKFDI